MQLEQDKGRILGFGATLVFMGLSLTAPHGAHAAEAAPRVAAASKAPERSARAAAGTTVATAVAGKRTPVQSAKARAPRRAATAAGTVRVPDAQPASPSTPLAGPVPAQAMAPATAALPAAPAPAVAAPQAAPAARPQGGNPYLAGWYRPTPVAVLPAMAVGQLAQNARYVSDSVTSLPGKLSDALPRIKTVHPTGGRDLVVASLKCPAEMVTGQYFMPANALREGVSGLLSRLNETQWLKFDIQLVCS